MFVGKFISICQWVAFILLPPVSFIFTFGAIGWLLVVAGVKDVPEGIDFDTIVVAFTCCLIYMAIDSITILVHHWRYMFKKYGKERHTK